MLNNKREALGEQEGLRAAACGVVPKAMQRAARVESGATFEMRPARRHRVECACRGCGFVVKIQSFQEFTVIHPTVQWFALNRI
jgi:hypothetical protein